MGLGIQKQGLSKRIYNNKNEKKTDINAFSSNNDNQKIVEVAYHDEHQSASEEYQLRQQLQQWKSLFSYVSSQLHHSQAFTNKTNVNVSTYMLTLTPA